MNIKEKYLLEEKKISPKILPVLMRKIEEYQDISDEFDLWLVERKYHNDNCVVVEGYSAYTISERAPKLDPFGVYCFLASLRKDPERAKKNLEDGFPVK